MSRLSEAFDRMSESLKRQNELIKKLGEDMDRLVEVFGQIKAHAKSEPRKAKSYVSPYAKFDKYHKKKRR